MSRVHSRQAEDSLGLINRTLAGHTEALRALSNRDMERRRRLRPDVDRVQLQRQATLVRFVSIAEAFVVERLTDRVGSWADGTSEHVQGMWSSEVIKAIATWEKLKEQYKQWLNVNDSALWRPMIGLTQVRNAVAHGLGVLTKMQLQPRSYQRTIGMLREIGISPDTDHRIVLSDEDIRNAARICREFVAALDMQTLAAAGD
ncbi:MULTISPECIES: hypothetical protein [Mycobacterium]|uniref:hypothetical protein n=1 Tax=Mycobacterium TaxID=1763 RepID=UPI0005B4FF8A|nr:MULTISPECIES: hypothetical protein [Mycobacterium]ASW85080.1 hypothetical protein CKJ61_09370 [Mycobacterium intracellulare]MCA2252109.1 hypothetical protein [Mycobacterium intracellulare]MCA2302921.1 hypothetical protein [Mycobacterium intracellulare]MCA2345487.1 hypothetical protein [Mycobacterium intracellulare]UGU02991.1 hypothetical protein LTS63_04385 [Mycobacterium intracellulare]